MCALNFIKFFVFFLIFFVGFDLSGFAATIVELLRADEDLDDDDFDALFEFAYDPKEQNLKIQCHFSDWRELYQIFQLEIATNMRSDLPSCHDSMSKQQKENFIHDVCLNTDKPTIIQTKSHYKGKHNKIIINEKAT